MCEVDFLPKWYPALRTRRTLCRAQAWASAAVVVAAGLFLLVQQRWLMIASADRNAARIETIETRGKVRELDDQVRLQAELLSKRSLVAQLGRPVELSRVIAELAACMPAEMSLDLLTFRTVESDRPIVEQQRSRPRDASARSRETPAKSRRLQVQIAGVAPTDSQVYAFFGELADRRFLDSVRLDRTSERRTDDHVMREFAVSFEVPLDFVPDASTPASATASASAVE